MLVAAIVVYEGRFFRETASLERIADSICLHSESLTRTFIDESRFLYCPFIKLLRVIAMINCATQSFDIKQASKKQIIT